MSRTASSETIVRPSAELIQAAAGFATATLHEAAGQIGALPAAIRPLAPKFRLCGPAFTVSTAPRDNLWIHRAIAIAEPGDVLVVDTQGMPDAGYWGEIMTVAAQARNLDGLVLNGCARDSAQLAAHGFPVFARGLFILGTGKNAGAPGALNEPLDVGGVTVNPGDLIVGDADGVVAIPRERIAEVLEKARQREAKEEGVLKRLKAGETTLKIYGWE